jgi:hypothetical protein
MGVLGNVMKDRSDKDRSYDGELMDIGGPAEAYIARYLEREYVRVVPVGKEKQRRDYRCYLPDGKMHLNEAKTDTKIAETKNIPWEIFRLEKKGAEAYISWGYASRCYRVIYYVPQWFRLLDVHAEDVRRVIFEHVRAKGRLLVAPTLTDKDRITFNFLVPLGLLKAKDIVKEVEIAEMPLAPPVPYQARLNGAKKDTAHAELERLKTNWRQVIEQAPNGTGRTLAAAILRSPGTTPMAIEADTVVLAFKYPLHKEKLDRAENRAVAEKIISNFLGHSCHVRCVYEPENSHLLDVALQMGAQIIDSKREDL